MVPSSASPSSYFFFGRRDNNFFFYRVVSINLIVNYPDSRHSNVNIKPYLAHSVRHRQCCVFARQTLNFRAPRNGNLIKIEDEQARGEHSSETLQ